MSRLDVPLPHDSSHFTRADPTEHDSLLSSPINSSDTDLSNGSSFPSSAFLRGDDFITDAHTDASQSLMESIDGVQLGVPPDLAPEELSYDHRTRCAKCLDCFLRRPRYYARKVYPHPFSASASATADPSSSDDALVSVVPVTPPIITHVTPLRQSYPPNKINNRKYNIFLFVPQFLFEQFRYFANLYYLATALSQLIPELKVGYLFTYITPLVFVLSVTFAKESFDEFLRWRRDREVNFQKYSKWDFDNSCWKDCYSSEITVGDVVKVHKDERVPADCVLLRTSEKSGASFIRTDQLDGETDWKLRHAISICQQEFDSDEMFFGHAGRQLRLSVYCEAPKKEIYEFFGRAEFRRGNQPGSDVEPLGLENTLWANTVVATGTVIGLVVYTGDETRAVMNKTKPSNKVGKLDEEVNFETKFLFLGMFVLSLVCCLLRKQFEGVWLFIAMFVRYIILYSSIIPISLRVNMDISKAVYSLFINFDKKIKGTVVRNSSIPEDLGRIGYLFCDKTGTLTQNEMVFKKLVMGNVTFTSENMSRIKECLRRGLRSRFGQQSPTEAKLYEMSLAIALCHNVTPVYTEESAEEEEEEPEQGGALSLWKRLRPKSRNQPKNGSVHSQVDEIKVELSDDSDDDDDELTKLLRRQWGLVRMYQASSPDEVALVKFSEAIGLVLCDRSLKMMTLEFGGDEDFVELDLDAAVGENEEEGEGERERDSEREGEAGKDPKPSPIFPKVDPENYMQFEILMVFPFTSAAKRMGIVVRNRRTNAITFFLKGADTVVAKCVKPSDWLSERTDELALDGLRTLVFAKKEVSEEELARFQAEYKDAKGSMQDRAEKIAAVRREFETDMDLLGITGVEDLLQQDVQTTLENLRNAGMSVWMLTGDKVETAVCIARSTRLVEKYREITPVLADEPEVLRERLFRLLESEEKGLAIVLNGSSLQVCLDTFPEEFARLCEKCSSVVCARCAPTQKAKVVALVKKYTLGRSGFPRLILGDRSIRVAAVGDGGNDVSMIREAHVGLGIVGKEGKQASLAADFSVTQFSHIQRLILWHGRNSYTRAAKMSQFIVHRGIIISIIQCVFSAIYFFATVPIFTGWLLVGYTVIYTLFPVLAILTDTEVTEKVAEEFPEIYYSLAQVDKKLTVKTFLIWTWKACYQGGVIMLIQLLLAIFSNSSSLLRMQSIAFTSLIFTELIMIGLTSFRINLWMILAEIISFLAYVISIFVLPEYFDIHYILTGDFWWKVAVIVAASCLPIYLTSRVYRCLRPPQHSKLHKRRIVDVQQLGIA